jgi:phospholipase A1
MQCARMADNSEARLACFDRWARLQTPGQPASPAASALTTEPLAALTPSMPTHPGASDTPGGCKSRQQSELSRYWELEAASDCGTISIRGYRPISLSLIGSDSVNTAPNTPAPGHAASITPYNETETRIQLSVRTKIAQGLLTHEPSGLRDSLWFGYTQQSYWQIFSGDISRPFRITDHEPEIIYIHPANIPLQAGWRWRYSGVSLTHQSNGQALPLSRSWNRVILMAGLEKDDRFQLTGRLWQRLPETSEDDDNPDISDKVGRAEVAGAWHVNKFNTLGFTLRHSLRTAANGSIRLEWLKVLGGGGKGSDSSGLRLHTQLFSGYGDSLVDYNRNRTMISIGLSLVDW